jgi:hypothetical protein
MPRTDHTPRKSTKGKPLPGKWHEGRIQQAYDFALLGLSNEEMCPYMEVTVGTIQYWRVNRPGFKEALDKGRKGTSIKAVNKLLELALGYSHPDTHFVNDRVKEYDENGNLIKEYTNVIQIPTIKHYPPNFNALNKFLNVKERAHWLETLDININQNLNINQKIDLSDCTDKELELMEQIGMKSLVEKIPEQNASHN